MSANPIDLTTLGAVKNWVQIATANTSDDSIIQDSITAFSAYVLHLTGRGTANGSVPSASPFVYPVAYDEFYDGTGTLRLPIRNWPIVSVSSLNISGVAIPQSTGINVWGWVVDQDGRFISLRGGYSAQFASFQNYGYQGNRFGAASRTFGFAPGLQNVEVVYSAGFFGVPYDLEMCARKIVALNYKRRGWIGQRSQAMAQGAGTVSYDTWEMDKQSERTILFYQRRAA